MSLPEYTPEEREYWRKRAEESRARLQERHEESQKRMEWNHPEDCRRHKRKKLDTAWLLMMCRPCGEKKIRWMALRCPDAHIRMMGRDLAARHNISLKGV